MAKPGKSEGKRSKDIAGIGKPALLSGGNPQIAKGEGDGPVQTFIAAIPGWKADTAKRLDALIVSTVPEVQKAMKWNSPFYGVEGKGWFLSFHCYTNYIKVAFFRGRALHPLPPVASRNDDARYLHLYEKDKVENDLLVDWIRQASSLPGWTP